MLGAHNLTTAAHQDPPPLESDTMNPNHFIKTTETLEITFSPECMADERVRGAGFALLDLTGEIDFAGYDRRIFINAQAGTMTCELHRHPETPKKERRAHVITRTETRSQ